MTLKQLRSSLGLHEARQNRANEKYKRAKPGSASAKYWLARRKVEWPIIQLRKRQIKKAEKSSPRARLVAAAERCAANYRKNPGAYHYYAGGIQNTVVDRPTPHNWRSDCSQFIVGVCKLAGVPCPGSGTYMASNTDSIANGGEITSNPKPGDLGMYCYSMHDPRGTTHHVEMLVGTNPDGSRRHLGHGTQPIDSRTPGFPDYYLSFLP